MYFSFPLVVMANGTAGTEGRIERTFFFFFPLLTGLSLQVVRVKVVPFRGRVSPFSPAGNGSPPPQKFGGHERDVPSSTDSGF